MIKYPRFEYFNDPDFRRMLKKRILPFNMAVIIVMFLLFYFFGESHKAPGVKFPPSAPGLNTRLPAAPDNKDKPHLNKMAYYKQADADSEKYRESLHQDPYRTPGLQDSASHHGLLPVGGSSSRPDELLQKIEALQHSLGQPAGPIRKSSPMPGMIDPTVPGPARKTYPSRVMESDVFQQLLKQVHTAEASEPDPQLDKLNGILDKILRIQHPESISTDGPAAVKNPKSTGGAGSQPNTLPAVVQANQVLFPGATIALMVTADALMDGHKITKGQLIYGTVSIRDDRMPVEIHSIRCDQSIYTLAMQVYDMDGLPGIHIPGMRGREAARQSADRELQALNFPSFDPSIGAQAAGAGVQALKSLFSRRLKQVRVRVKEGYPVLLLKTK